MVKRYEVRIAYNLLLKHYKMVDRIMQAYFSSREEITFESFYREIIENQEQIKSITIFLDMDNCLAHFSNGKYEDLQVLERAKEKGFFRNLEKMDEDIEIYEAMNNLGFNIYALSACMDTPYCRNEKIEWMHEHMPWLDDEKIILCNVGENKAEIAKKRANIINFKKAVLIDDYKGNLLKWKEYGGFSIKKAISFKPDRPYPTLINHRDVPYYLFGIAMAKK